MKKFISIFLLSFFIILTSCQTRVVAPDKPLRANSLELYHNYTIQTTDAKVVKVKILRQDTEKIYAKEKNGNEIIINKSDIREVRKTDVISSIIVGLAAVAAVIFIPI